MTKNEYDLTRIDAHNMCNDELANWIENISNEEGFGGYEIDRYDYLALAEVVRRLRAMDNKENA